MLSAWNSLSLTSKNQGCDLSCYNFLFQHKHPVSIVSTRGDVRQCGPPCCKKEQEMHAACHTTNIITAFWVQSCKIFRKTQTSLAAQSCFWWVVCARAWQDKQQQWATKDISVSISVSWEGVSCPCYIPPHVLVSCHKVRKDSQIMLDDKWRVW